VSALLHLIQNNAAAACAFGNSAATLALPQIHAKRHASKKIESSCACNQGETMFPSRHQC
jgi:hypothetical protein